MKCVRTSALFAVVIDTGLTSNGRSKWSCGYEYRTRYYQAAVGISPRVNCKQPWSSWQPTVCLSQLSRLTAGWEMSSSLRATGWRPMCGWLERWYVCWLLCMPNCSLAWLTDGRIMRHSIYY